MSQRNPNVAEIALPIALRRTLSYGVPEEWLGKLRPGHRVRVPLRGRETHGYVVSLSSAESAGRTLKPIAGVVPEEPLLDEAILDVARWVSDYYASPLGEVLESALPAQVWKGPPKRGTDPTLGAGDLAPHRPTQDQDQAVRVILDAVAGRDRASPSNPPVFLLQGVPGSGKTEIYLRIAAHLLEQGRGCLVLVPEIAMGTQVVQRFAERLGPKVGFFHSAMPPGRRRSTWWRARRGEIQVVVGTRSAVFVPIRDLGAVIVDEEHEVAYKQSESPRYHGRDVALLRARRAGAVSVVASATPSLESRRNVELGKYQLLLLPERVEKRPPAKVVLVDLRPAGHSEEEVPREGGPEVVHQPRVPGQSLSPLLDARLNSCLERGEQAIIFLNRRGHSTSVQCQDCGHVFRCPHCSVILTYHREGAVLQCHYCGHRMRGPSACTECEGEVLFFGGAGTQKIEGELRRRFPDARILRMDLDTTRRRGAHGEMIQQFESGEVDILVGTQMVGKGLDFPGVTLVGVLLADREMAIPDFRGQERAFQILTQVAGRAGRSHLPGVVVLQTFMPEHFVIQAAARLDYDAFYEAESAERRTVGFPPFSRLVNVLLDDPKEERVARRARSLQKHLADRMGAGGGRGIALLGPAPMAVEKLKGRHRWHLTLKGDSVKALRPWIAECIEWDQRRGSPVRLMIDVDPAHLI